MIKFQKFLKRFSVFALGVVVVMGCENKEDSADVFFERGVAYFEAGEYDKARVELLNTQQRNPRHPKVYYYMGMIARKDGEIAIVYEMMSKALKLDPLNVPAKLSVAELLVFAKRFDQALDLVDEVIEKDALNFDALRIKAAALVGMGRLIQAEKVLVVAEGIQKGHDSIVGLKAIIARERGAFPQAITYLDQAIERTEDKKQYLLLRSKIHRDIEDVEALIKDLKLLDQVDPDQPHYMYALAKIYIRQKQYQVAEDGLRRLVERQADNAEAKQLLLDVIFLQDDARAETLLAQWMEMDAENSALKFYKVRRDLKSGKVEQAKQFLEVLALKSNDQNVRLKAKALYAETLMFEGHRDEAIELILGNLAEDPNQEESLLVKAKYNFDNRDYDFASASLLTVVRNNPESEKALVMLGDIYGLTGSKFLADDAYRQVLKINPANEEAAFPVVQVLLEKDDLERSETIVARLLDSKPNDTKLLAFYAQIKLMKKDWAGAALITKRLERLDSSQVLVAFLSGRVSQGRGDCATAIQYFESALTSQPQLVSALESLAECYSVLGQTNDMLAFLQAHKQKHPDFVQAYAMSAELYQQAGDLRAAEKELHRALEIDPKWIKGYGVLAGVRHGLEDAEGAIRTYQKGIAVQPDNVYLRILLGAYYQSLKRFENARAQYETVLELDNNNLLARNNLATLLLTEFTSPESFARALELASAFKQREEPHFLDTYGWALFKVGRYNEAESVLRVAAERAQGLGEVQLHLAEALSALERYHEARVVVGRAQKLSSNSARVSAGLVQLSIRIDEAIQGP